MKNEILKQESEVLQSTKNMIIIIRDQPVIIDSDLAEIYGVTTKQLNQQIKRNIEKFPEDFLFHQLQIEIILGFSTYLKYLSNLSSINKNQENRNESF